MNISYFNYKDNKKRSDIVSISVYQPQYIKNIVNIPELTPNKDLFDKSRKGLITFDDFFDGYLDKLNKLGIDGFNKLNLENKIICCHCKDVLSCHRFILSCWYYEQTGKNIEELGIESIVKYAEKYE